MSAYRRSMSSRGRAISVAHLMMRMVFSAVYICRKILGLRDGRLQRDKIETTTVGCGFKDLLRLEWPAPYGSVVPGSSALSEKARPDWEIRQLAHLLRVVKAPKKGGRSVSMNKGRSAQGGGGSRSRPRDPLYAEVELSLDLDNHFLTRPPDPHSDAALIWPVETLGRVQACESRLAFFTAEE